MNEHGPAWLHEGGPRVGVDVSQEEPAVAEALGEVGELLGGDDASGMGGGAEALDDAGAVGIGLEAANAPQARVAEGAVVEVHGVLGGNDDADAERPGLLHQGDQRPLRGRIGGVAGGSRTLRRRRPGRASACCRGASGHG